MSYGEEDRKRSDEISFKVQNAIKASPLFQSFTYGLSPYEIPNDQFNKQNMRIPGGEWQEVFHVKVYNSFFDVYEIAVSKDKLPESEHEILMNETARKLFSKGGQSPTELESTHIW